MRGDPVALKCILARFSIKQIQYGHEVFKEVYYTRREIFMRSSPLNGNNSCTTTLPRCHAEVFNGLLHFYLLLTMMNRETQIPPSRVRCSLIQAEMSTWNAQLTPFTSLKDHQSYKMTSLAFVEKNSYLDRKLNFDHHFQFSCLRSRNLGDEIYRTKVDFFTAHNIISRSFVRRRHLQKLISLFSLSSILYSKKKSRFLESQG